MKAKFNKGDNNTLIDHDLSETERGALSYLRSEKRLNESYLDEIRCEQADGLEGYEGTKSNVPEIEGGSTVISRDIYEAVESIVPNVVNIFKKAKQVFEFDPVGDDDVEAVKMENAFIRQEMNRLGIHSVVDTAVRDAGTQKVGYGKCYWEQAKEKVKEKYEDKTIEELQLLLMDRGYTEGDYTIISQEEIEVEASEEGLLAEAMPSKFNIEIEIEKDCSGARLCNVAPENLLVDRMHTSTDLSGCRFVAEKMPKTASELVAEGYDPEKVKEIPTSVGEFYDQDYIDRYGDWGQEKDNKKPYNDSGRFVIVWEVYCRIDFDEDGIEEYRRFIIGGDQMNVLLENEEVDDNPYFAGVLQPQSHKHFGKSIYDIACDIQEITTHFWRQALDNATLANNPRPWVRAENVNLDDLINGDLTSPIRMQGDGPVSEYLGHFNTPFIGNQVLAITEYFEGKKEGRLGVNKQTQGLDTEALKGQTMFGVREILSQSMLRSSYYAGIFGETFIKPLVLKMHKLFRKYGSGDLYVRRFGKFHPVNPREWVERKDMELNVGVGVNSNEDNVVVLNRVLDLQREAIQLQGGVDDELMPVTIDKIYNAIEDMLEYSGLKGVGKYFNRPDIEAIKAKKSGEKPKSNPALELAKAEIASKERIKDSELDLEAEKIGHDAGIKNREIALKERELALEIAKFEEETGKSVRGFELKEKELELKEEKQDNETIRDLVKVNQGR